MFVNESISIARRRTQRLVMNLFCRAKLKPLSQSKAVAVVTFKRTDETVGAGRRPDGAVFG